MFSILMSCYSNDNPVFLTDSLNSILFQTIKPAEFILVCDGPLTDDLYNIINDFKERFLKDNVNFLIHQLDQNSGLGVALYEGSLLCSQEFIIRMDSDDISDINRISVLRDYLCSHKDVDILGSYISEFVFAPNDLNRLRVVPLDTDSIRNRSFFFNPMNHVSVCIRRSCLLKMNYENVLWHEDYFLWLKHLNVGSAFVNIPQSLVYVRVSGFGARRSGLKYLKSEFNFLKNCYERNYFSLFNCFFYIVPRIFIRIMPDYFFNFIYRFLRKQK